ncbi:MAG: DUF1553 domain-containing protein [Pirellulales bacterium]|nr:DUF1553 domain-containing protein [Pirellulales bacterium]
MCYHRTTRGLLVVAVAAALAAPAAADSPWNAERFDRQLAPWLARHCLECHNSADPKGGLDLTQRDAALRGGDSGPALVAGNRDESHAWQRVVAGEMPPEMSLADDERELLGSWIAAGAPWGTDPIDRFRYSTDHRAGYDWWSLAPIVRPDPPAAADPRWNTQPIDRFVFAGLSAAGLTPSPEAGKRVLIRRLYYDLWGLPPEPEAVAAFETDGDPAAYDRLVDRLLAAPQYGERWARHWLDVVRFAETNGFEYDEPRRDAWPYRDWVIAALNEDLPYDEFCRRQLAGDVLAPDDASATVATGFLAAGPYDTPGQSQQSAAMKAVVRQDEMEDLVGTIGQTFLGLTLNCARCHDHKFDPLLQRDYYRVVAALSGVRQGVRDITTPAQRETDQQQWQQARDEVASLAAQLDAIDAPIRVQIASQRASTPSSGDQALRPIARWDFDDLRDGNGAHAITLQGSAALGAGALNVDGSSGFATTEPLIQDVRAKTLQAWVQLANLNQRGGAAISLLSADGQVFDAIVFAEREAGQWLAGSNGFERTESFQAPAETEADGRAVRITITYADDGTIAAYRDGLPYGQPYQTGPPVLFAAGQAYVAFGLRHQPPGGNRMLAGAIERAELYDRALTPAEVARAGDEIPADEIIARLDPETARRRAALAKRLDAARSRLAAPRQRNVYCCRPRQPEPTHVLRRGDPRQPADLVAAGGIAAMGPASEFGLAPDGPEDARRAALANWIASRDNPLFARVMVNRVWHYHFGAGLVDTPNDFGFNGARPSHPELLDWLAAEFRDGGFRLKQLHRLIVTSATYRQASLARAEAVERDASNRLLWRYTPRRLEAEALRDSMLAVAGRLNPLAGGPGFKDYEELNRSGTWSYLPAERSGPEFERRTVYRTTTRGGRGGLLDAFDCPDPSTTTPRRAVTTTPLQALALLNNAFVLRMSDAFTERVEHEAGSEVAAQIERAFRLVYGRAATERETAIALALVREQGLASLARVLLNSNEFVYVD